MGRPPIRPQKAPPKTGDPTVDRALLEQHRRLMELEDRSDLSGSVASSVVTLSGTVNAHFIDLSGSVDSAIRTLTSGGLTAVSHDSSLSGDGTAANKLSALPTFSSLQAGVTSSVGSAYSSLQLGVSSSVASVYSSLQVGTTASIGSAYSSLQAGVTSSVGTLSGTVNARFLNLTGSVISSISETNSSLKAGVTASIGSAYSSLQAGVTSSVSSAYSSLQTGVTASIDSLSGTINSAIVDLSGSVVSAFFNAEFSGALATNFYDFSGSIDAAILVHGIDPRRSFQFYNDFTDMNIGTVGSAGTGGTTYLSWETTHPGTLICQCAAVSSYGYWQPIFTGISDWTMQFVPAGGRLYYEAMVKIPTLSNGTDNIRCVIGFGDSVAGSMTNGIWIENDYSIHFNNFWYLATSWGGAGHTYVAIGSNAVGGGAWCRLNFEIAADGDAVTGSVNGSGSNVITSTIPTAVQVNQIVYCRKIAGTNTRNFHCDYVRMWQVFTGSRE